MQPMMHLIGYCGANIGVELPGSNVKPEQMGHCLITNIGTLGLKEGYAPLCSPTFTQMVACFGAHHKKPVYDEKTDSIKVGEIMTGVFTFDHRFGDAAVAGPSLNITTDFINDPENFDPNKYVDKITAAEREKNLLNGIVDDKKKKGG